MNLHKLIAACCLSFAFQVSVQLAAAGDLTLRSLGAVGDGRTDDRAAIQAALTKANGRPVDGEGATYAVHGNVEINCGVNLRNATLVETMKPVDISKFIPSAKGKSKPTVEPPEALREMVGPLPLLHYSGVASYAEDPALTAEDLQAVLPAISVRTLAVIGSKEKPVAVRLEKVKIQRGNQPQTGNPDGGGIVIDFASPVVMSNVEVTGDGKGCGIYIKDSQKIKLERLNIHDMLWAPYGGDNVFETTPLKVIKETFGWNNFPIYKFDSDLKRFVRVRIQEQISGLHVRDCEEVELLDSQVARLQTKIGDQLYALQADGVTMANIKRLTVRRCHFSNVWEGIDFTANVGEDFFYEDNTTSDTFTFGFKLAHPKRNGKMVNCTSYGAGNTGFVMEPEMENIEFIHCHAVETGANGYWTKEDGSRLMTTAGFKLDTKNRLATPLRVKFDNCTAINTNHPSTMDFGFICDDGIDPAKRQIIAIECAAQGAKVKGIQGIVTK